jgi:hypothetical protein
MKKTKLVDIKDNVWKRNPFAIAWKKKNMKLFLARQLFGNANS